MRWLILFYGVVIPVVFISKALSPSDVKWVSINEENHSALVVVPDDQLSLAIGKRGSKRSFSSTFNRLEDWY